MCVPRGAGLQQPVDRLGDELAPPIEEVCSVGHITCLLYRQHVRRLWGHELLDDAAAPAGQHRPVSDSSQTCAFAGQDFREVCPHQSLPTSRHHSRILL